MENKLEELLNKLIEKGWKPFGDERIVPYVKIDCRQIAFYKLCDDGIYQWLFDADIRTVLSKESLLWQFVCENGMVKHDQYTNTTRIQEYEDERDSETYRTKYDEGSYQSRLLESALKDESELETFILDNIKV